MIVNNTCVSGNNTSTCLGPGSAAGPPAWPVVFLLLLLIPAGVAAYKYRAKIRSAFRSVHGRSQKKEESNGARAAESHPYVHRGQSSAKQAPIYENLTAQKAGSKKSRLNQMRSSREHGEDLYLQCDFADDAIYSNDPACSLSILPDPHEDDLYILPDA